MINISDPAFEYLKVQVGELSELQHLRGIWEMEYRRLLRDRMNELLPHLPRAVRAIMDVGSGLGGIDILLHRHYDRKPRVTLVDGGMYPPEVVRHSTPFCNGQIAMDFQRANGVQTAGFMDCEELSTHPQDLIVSFRAWCFHIEPRIYLSFVRACCHDDTVVIADIRRHDPWRRQVLEAFDGYKIGDWQKCERWRLIPR